MLYSLVFVMQLFCLVCNILVMFDAGRMQLYLTTSRLLFVVSFFIMIGGIVTGAKATRANCFTILLFMINLTLVILYLFTNFLGGFLQSGQ